MTTYLGLQNKLLCRGAFVINCKEINVCRRILDFWLICRQSLSLWKRHVASWRGCISKTKQKKERKNGGREYVHS